MLKCAKKLSVSFISYSFKVKRRHKYNRLFLSCDSTGISTVRVEQSSYRWQCRSQKAPFWGLETCVGERGNVFQGVWSAFLVNARKMGVFDFTGNRGCVGSGEDIIWPWMWVCLQQTFQTGVDRSDTDRHMGILGGIFLCYFPYISDSHRLKFILYLSKGAKVAWFQTIARALLQTATRYHLHLLAILTECTWSWSITTLSIYIPSETLFPI